MPLRLVLIVLMAGYLVLGFAPAIPGGATFASPAAADDCCDPSPGEDGDPGENGCCPDGCHHCSLPCCGGSSVLAGCAVMAPDIPLDETGLTAAASPGIRGTDPRRIYHPPRA